MQIGSIQDLARDVRAAGEMAFEAQRTLRYDERSLKRDGSILTAADKRVEHYLSERIERAYPGTNLLGEESVWSFDPLRPYTFVIDPIDGTDVYSQGMHGWCVSVGLLDQALVPVAGAIYAPRLDLFLLADVGQAATLNGAPIPPPGRAGHLSAASNVMAYSKVHQQVDLRHYPGKVRSIGSAALHICFTLIYPGVLAAVEGHGVHIWDIAGAHAVVRSHGLNDSPPGRRRWTTSMRRWRWSMPVPSS
jgi:fructose-1,6-bisphosphatase/inositol monophosphatase family enzyme